MNVSACTEDFLIVRMDVSAENIGVHGSICPYISTKVMDVHAVSPTDEFKVKKFVCGRMDAYDKCRRYKPVRYIGTDIVGKVWKGVSYADALQQVS